MVFVICIPHDNIMYCSGSLKANAAVPWVVGSSVYPFQECWNVHQKSSGVTRNVTRNAPRSLHSSISVFRFAGKINLTGSQESSSLCSLAEESKNFDLQKLMYLADYFQSLLNCIFYVVICKLRLFSSSDGHHCCFPPNCLSFPFLISRPVRAGESVGLLSSSQIQT